MSTLYISDGTPQSLVVTIPAAGGGTGGTPSGTVFTGGLGFSGKPAFAFVSEDGVLTTWNGGTTAAVIRADLSASGAIFKGMAVAANASGANEIFATDFHNDKIDVFDSNYQPVILDANAFTDPSIPAGFAPFNIQTLGGSLYVTYAKQDEDAEDDAAGPGNGFVAVFATDGTLLRHLVSRGHLNSPWGLAIAPAGFGAYGGDLLVGNFGDGAVDAYDPTSGTFLGQLLNDAGKPLSIPGLWALVVGNGGQGGSANALYFTSGPGDESHGLFGSLTAE